MRNVPDIIGSVLLIFVGLSVTIESAQLHVGSPLTPQAGFFPFLGGLLLIALALILLVQGCRRRSSSSQHAREGFGELRRPAILVVSMIIYAAVLEPLGYVLPTLIITAVILKVLGVTSWKVLILASIGLSVGTYLLFGRILGVDLPAGILPLFG